MNLMRKLWNQYEAKLDRMTVGEKVVLLLALLILGSVWLIFLVTPMHR